MKCNFCPNTFVEYDGESVWEHLTIVAHPGRSETRNVLRKTRRDKSRSLLLDPIAGGSTNKQKNKRQAQKSQLSSEPPWITANETSYQGPANLLPISENKKPDLNECDHKPPLKRIKIEPGTDEPTVNCVKEKIPLTYVHYDYNTPDFIPLTRNSPKVKSELVLSPMMVKTEPR